MNHLLVALAALAGLLGLVLGALAIVVWSAASQVIRRRTPDAPADPADLGLEYEPVVFESRDGLQLGGWFVPGAKPVRGTVIFCHGHAGSLDPDLQYVPAFHRRGFDVLQFDFRAHGRSEGLHVSMGCYERLDLLGAVDLLQSNGIEKIGVLGFSMGGAVAIGTAAQCPAITAVISDGGFARLSPTLERGLQERGLPSLLASILAPIVLRTVGKRLGCDPTSADPIHWIGQLSPRPVLLVHGGQDAYIPRIEIERLYAAAGNPKELWIVPEAGHRRAVQTRPEEYMARVLGFFERWLVEERHHGQRVGL
jgi:alpha-beta hydrolase superfamily lysophospholipase